MGGAALRVAVLVVASAYAALALTFVGGDLATRSAVAVAVGALVAWRCAAPAPHVVVVLGGLALAGEATSFAPVVLALAPLAHLLLRVAWWASHVPLAARVELRALLPDARRFVVVQGAVQAVGVVLLLVAGTVTSPVVLAVGGAALLALTVVLLRRT
ncbi:hypothetical protein [Cellulosimicrobium sp. CUA-896]|uniref:hypothetical protein n=1 Tax=Cellulosimicrobium sp. CUA-896 TaxID=1517881 RepID=UPI0011151B09|nr:hypothetical protein [Cellulosimicrobium sp. CUA-896]